MRRSKSRRAARSIPVRGVTTVTGWLMMARMGVSPAVPRRSRSVTTPTT